MLIEPFFLESPSALIKPSSSGAFNPQLEASLLIAVKTVMSQMGDYDFTGEIREQDSFKRPRSFIYENVSINQKGSEIPNI